MAGTIAGGRKAAQKNLASDPDFYKKIGARGGSNGRSGGFAAYVQCICRDVRGPHHKAQCAGRKGGRVSTRKVKKLEAA